MLPTNKKYFSILRSQEWWLFKLPPILVAGYIILLKKETPLTVTGPALLIVLLALLVGASYVSMINDMTDIKDDAAAGKKNRMANLRPSLRWFFLSLSVAAGVAIFYYLYQHPLSALFFSLAWISFTLYSVPPFRFKSRKILGVLADACGSQVFPSLLVISFLSYKTQQPVNTYYFIAVAVWSLCFGLRGILWHQCIDQHNDLKTGFRSIFQMLTPLQEKIVTALIVLAELIGLTYLLVYAASAVAIIGLGLYFLYAIAIRIKWHVKMIGIRPPADGNRYQIFMHLYYLAMFPIAILISLSLQQQYAWILLVCHLFFFTGKKLFRLFMN